MWQRDLGAIWELFEADSNAIWASRIRSRALPNEEKPSKSLAREMNRRELILNDPPMKIDDFRRIRNVQIIVCVLGNQVLQASLLQ